MDSRGKILNDSKTKEKLVYLNILSDSDVFSQ